MIPSTYWTSGRPFYMALLAVLLLTSCSQKMRFQNSSVTPAAQGAVKIKKDNNDNYAISINVTHLATPDRLTPPKKAYVVWMVPENNMTKSLGQLKSSTGFLSGTLKGSLKTVTTLKPVRFFITGEDNPSVAYPGTPIVLTTH